MPEPSRSANPGGVTDRPGGLAQRLRYAIASNRLFSCALLGGALLRLLAVLGYPGALWFAGDSYVYLGAALRPQPNLSKSTGYSLFLRLLLPAHSLTLVIVLQHLMGLADAVMIYALLRHNRVAKRWAAIATLPVLFDGYVIESEHLIMTETLFTFLLLGAMVLILWRRRVSWWVALTAGLMIGYAAVVRTDGAVVLVLFPLFLLLRDWRALRGWALAVAMALGCLVPVGAYASWFHQRHGHYGMTMSTGFYLWGRVSSFADCAVIKPTGAEAAICPTEPLSTRTPPGDFVWHACETQYKPQLAKCKGRGLAGGSVTYENNKVLTSFAEHAVEAQPLDYVKTVVLDTGLAFGFPRINYPGAGTVYYYDFHMHYKTAKYDLLPPNTHEWIQGGTAYQDWLSYGHQAPGQVVKVFAAPILAYQRLVFTYGPLFALILLLGLGGVFGVRRPLLPVRLRPFPLYWRPRGTSMLPWVTAIGLLITPIAVADFDYRYLLPVLPFACLAAGLSFAPARVKPAPDALPSGLPTKALHATDPGDLADSGAVAGSGQIADSEQTAN